MASSGNLSALRNVPKVSRGSFPDGNNRRSVAALMDCQRYLAQVSEFLDGRATPELSGEMEAHRSECDRCREYTGTLEEGGALFRSLTPLEVPADFRSRLDHRIFHLEDGASIARHSMGSGATMVSVVTVAALVTLSAWAPSVHLGDPNIELPAVVVEPPAPSFLPTPAHPSFPRNMAIFSTTEFQEGIWGDSHDLLREYSPILDRRRGQAHARIGIQ